MVVANVRRPVFAGRVGEIVFLLSRDPVFADTPMRQGSAIIAGRSALNDHKGGDHAGC
jgi:hypothetical protein